MPKQSWQTGLRNKVWLAAQKTHPTHLHRLISLLRGLAAEVEEKADSRHTRILSTYPYMPPKYFALCVGVSYDVGLKLYKKWCEKNGKTPLRNRRISAEQERQWEAIVLQEVLKAQK